MNAVLAAVAVDGRALEHASAALQNDRDVVLVARETDGVRRRRQLPEKML